MNAAQRLADRLAPETRFIYRANTYHESLSDVQPRPPVDFVGREMVVVSGRWVKRVAVPGVPDGFHMEVPRAAKHVEWLDDDTVRYAIVGRPEHHVTLHFPARFVAGTHAVKVKLPGAKRWAFITPSGGTTHLRIHAAMCTEDEAKLYAERIPVDNPGVEAKVVPF